MSELHTFSDVHPIEYEDGLRAKFYQLVRTRTFARNRLNKAKQVLSFVENEEAESAAQKERNAAGRAFNEAAKAVSDVLNLYTSLASDFASMANEGP